MTALFARSDVKTVIMMGAALAGSAGDSTYYIPATKTLAVIGNLDLNSPAIDYVINAYDGNFDISGLITATAADILILNATDKGKISSSQLGSAVAPLLVTSIPASGTPAAAEPVLIENLSISSASDLNTYAASERLYVLGDLTTTGAAVFTTAKVTVFRNTIAGDDITLTSDTELRGELKANATTVAVTGLDNFAGTLNTNGNTFTVAEAVAIELAALSGTGTLALTEDVTGVDIAGGTGSVTVTGTPVTLATANFRNEGSTTFAGAVTANSTASFAGPATFTIGLTLGSGIGATFDGDAVFGTLTTDTVAVTFNEDATFTGAVTAGSGAITFGGNAGGTSLTKATGNITFDENATFTGAVSTGAGTATFTGPATLAAFTSTGTVEFTSTADFSGIVSVAGTTFGETATFADAVTLGGVTEFGGDAVFTTGKTITLSASAITLKTNNSLVVADVGQDQILTANGGDVTLTPGASGTISFAAASKRLAQNGADITIAGPASLAASASYFVVQSRSLTLDAGASFSLGEDAELILDHNGTNGAALKGTGELIAGGTKIVGGTTGWSVTENTTSNGGNITITPNTITGSTTAMVLTAGGNDSVITVAGETNLTIDVGTVIALGGNGGTTVGSIELKDEGIITLAGTGSSITANAAGTGGDNSGITGITPVGVTFVSVDTNPDKLVSVTASSVSGGSLTATADTTISSNTTVDA
jgi:hypothetical protein